MLVIPLPRSFPRDTCRASMVSTYCCIKCLLLIAVWGAGCLVMLHVTRHTHPYVLRFTIILYAPMLCMPAHVHWSSVTANPGMRYHPPSNEGAFGWSNHSTLCLCCRYVGGPTMAMMALKSPSVKVTVVDINEKRQVSQLPGCWI